MDLTKQLNAGSCNKWVNLSYLAIYALIGSYEHIQPNGSIWWELFAWICVGYNWSNFLAKWGQE